MLIMTGTRAHMGELPVSWYSMPSPRNLANLEPARVYISESASISGIILVNSSDTTNEKGISTGSGADMVKFLHKHGYCPHDVCND